MHTEAASVRTEVASVRTEAASVRTAPASVADKEASARPWVGQPRQYISGLISSWRQPGISLVARDFLCIGPGQLSQTNRNSYRAGRWPKPWLDMASR